MTPGGANAAAAGQNGTVTTPFPTATSKSSGYHRKQVDEFLDRARRSYEQAEGAEPMTAADIRQMAFAVQRKGYSARHVDAAMDRLEEVFFERERRARIAEIGEDAWWAQTRELLSEVRGRLDREPGKRFRRRGLFASGYRRAQVDAFLDQVKAMLLGEVALTTAEVRGVVFHPQWRGYHEDQVDNFLDAVVELMLSIR